MLHYRWGVSTTGCTVSHISATAGKTYHDCTIFSRLFSNVLRHITSYPISLRLNRSGVDFYHMTTCYAVLYYIQGVRYPSRINITHHPSGDTILRHVYCSRSPLHVNKQCAFFAERPNVLSRCRGVYSTDRRISCDGTEKRALARSNPGKCGNTAKRRVMRLWSIQDAVREIRRGWLRRTRQRQPAPVAPSRPRLLLLLRLQDRAWRRSANVLAFCSSIPSQI